MAAVIDELPAAIAEACRRVIDAGGRRLRPELVIRCADAGPAGSARAVTAAAAVELLHSASLVHDDLLDDADTRRGVTAIHRREGRGAAVLAGDALIALSWRAIAACGPVGAADLGSALLAMCDGQCREDELRFRQDASPSDVLQVASRKTGELLAAACRIGARLGGCTDHQVTALGEFGQALGVQLQVLDDVLDIVSDDTALGKPTGCDFRAGIVTLPTVFGLSGARIDAERLGELFVPGAGSEAALLARSIVVDSGAVAKAVAVARTYAKKAAWAAMEAGVADLIGLPERYLEHQLLKVADDCRIRVTSSPRGIAAQQLLSPSPDRWPVDRAV